MFRKISVKLFIFITSLGLHPAVLLKNVTYPSKIFYKKIS